MQVREVKPSSACHEANFRVKDWREEGSSPAEFTPVFTRIPHFCVDYWLPKKVCYTTTTCGPGPLRLSSGEEVAE